MGAIYNEIEPYAADWLGNLVAGGHIAQGRVDRRSIRELQPADLDGTQAHFFAGIGVWSYALRLAGWPDDREVWTGSCPCQPFSAAGKRKGAADDRHLWPEWFRLIRECRPAVVFGEQVAAASDWLDLVSSDLEGEGYAFGAAVLGAHSVGAPHIRQRLYFVAHAADPRRGVRTRRPGEEDWRAPAEPGGLRQTGVVGDPDDPRPQGRSERRDGADQLTAGPAGLAGFWADAEWVNCTDGRRRAVEPGSFPLAHGIAGRVGKLRAYGNAIVPQVAATFIHAVMASALPYRESRQAKGEVDEQ